MAIMFQNVSWPQGGNNKPNNIYEVAKYSLVVISKRSTYLANKHLKDEHAKSPPVHRTCVRRLRQNLRCKELRRTTERRCSIAEAHPFLAKSKVGNFHKSISIEQQIVQLQIPVFTTECTWLCSFITASW